MPSRCLDVREYHAGHDGLSRALRRAGYASTRFDPYVGGSGGCISPEDLELDSVIDLEVEKIEGTLVSLADPGRDFNH